MIIMHNHHDKASRDYVEANGSIPGVTVLNWYSPGQRRAWVEAGGTLELSAFPAILLRHDKFTDDEAVEHEAGWDVVTEPSDIQPLPIEGQQVDVGVYSHNGGYVICRQAHTRMAFEPSETPALFSVWRADEDKVYWIANEPVNVGDLRTYDGVQYECIQAHTTQVDWIPPNVPALWQVYVAPPVGPQPWIQPQGAHDAYQLGDQVTYNGQTWESTINANVWAPGVFGWVVV